MIYIYILILLIVLLYFYFVILKNFSYYFFFLPNIDYFRDLFFFKSFFIFFSKLSNLMSNWILSTNHKRIAVMYFIFVIIAGFTGLILATIIRIELAYPGQNIIINNAEKYLTIISLHGVVMVFFMIIPVIFGAFGNFLLPTQLGIRDVAFPRLNSFMFWITPSGFVMLLHIILFDKSYNLTYWINYSELRVFLRRRFFFNKSQLLDYRLNSIDSNLSLRLQSSSVDFSDLNFFLKTENSNFWDNYFFPLFNNFSSFKLKSLISVLSESFLPSLLNFFSCISNIINVVLSQFSSFINSFFICIINFFNNIYYLLVNINFIFTYFKFLIMNLLDINYDIVYFLIDVFFYTIADTTNKCIASFIKKADSLVFDFSFYINNPYAGYSIAFNPFFYKFLDYEFFVYHYIFHNFVNFIDIFNVKDMVDFTTWVFNFSLFRDTISSNTDFSYFSNTFNYFFNLSNIPNFFNFYSYDQSFMFNSFVNQSCANISGFSSLDISNFFSLTYSNNFSENLFFYSNFDSMSSLFIKKSFYRDFNLYSYNFNLFNIFYLFDFFKKLNYSISYTPDYQVSLDNLNTILDSYINSLIDIDYLSDWQELHLEREVWRSVDDLSIARRHWQVRKLYFANFFEPDTLINKVSIWLPNQLIPGWAFITPYSSRLKFSAIGKVDIALVVVLLASLGSVFSSVNYIITYRYIGAPIFKNRKEMRSFFVDALLVASRMMLLANPALIIGIILLLSDRHFNTSVFDFSGGGDTILFQHLFWFFGHPEVYIIIIPCFGFMNSLLPHYLKKRLSGRLSLQFSMYTIAFMGFAVWGHHMYMVGLANSVRTLYSTMTVMISVPASTKVLHWCVTIINSSVVCDVGFLFLLSFMYFFVLGGLSGMFLAHIGFDVIFHDTFFVIGHFHVMLAGAAMSCIFAAFYFYFSSIFGVKYSRVFAYLHFFFYIAGQLITLIPMFWLGYAGMPRRIMDYPSAFGGWHSIISSGHILTFLSLVFFLLMIFYSLYEGRSGSNKARGISRLNKKLLAYTLEVKKVRKSSRKSLFLKKLE